MAGEPVLTGSVGAGGLNHSPDVGLVQVLLNNMRGVQRKTLLSVDGVCGPLTITAIKEFQAAFGSATDGRIDPGGPTLRLLIYAYVTLRRLGVYRLGPFPASFAQLTFRAFPDSRELGMVVRGALSNVKRGITPMLKPAPKPTPVPPRPPRPEGRDIVEQNV
jgi:peptidoglycan hydrolase-like protein with peptidoglycan-binding domain